MDSSFPKMESRKLNFLGFSFPVSNRTWLDRLHHVHISFKIPGMDPNLLLESQIVYNLIHITFATRSSDASGNDVVHIQIMLGTMLLNMWWWIIISPEHRDKGELFQHWEFWKQINVCIITISTTRALDANISVEYVHRIWIWPTLHWS